MPRVFVIVRDARGSLIHVRRRDDGECIGCIEAGLFEIVRALVLAEVTGASEGTEAPAAYAAPSLAAAAARRNDDEG